jgi:hypothetical protein
MKKILISLIVVALSASLSSAEQISVEAARETPPVKFNAGVAASLAESYLEGDHVPKSEVEALKWWLISQEASKQSIRRITAETGFICGWHLADVGRKLTLLEERMSETEVASANWLAEEWIAANSN